MQEPLIETERLKLIQVTANDAPAVADYYRRNQEHLKPWEPARDPYFYSLEGTEERLHKAWLNSQSGSGYSFGLVLKDSGDLIGMCAFSNIVRGVFQACHLGYSIDGAWEGKGLMSEAISGGIAYMFNEVGLHRIMANHLPHNRRSEMLLRKLGFEREGYAKAYLMINGVWQDHVLNALVRVG
ncbi:ribosomal protein S5-alanine N-acetyltransferase [Noviherbaspirillum galbum]|uniref:[Ribosomal protein uS5]-alanine N-acetyltransferase n=1 Tax=Noviherbaspirillum galbum TaxID=2709383 RepID=A0A6B3SJT4_9BURK|nr:ribosomal protein S5-alanine N-acetyltransferase [Noviherbaspirillum galbum]NEX60818.1 ribosomal protein S5-alanine N-acetyltransferase [Noviherbaspirillum galbum]